MRTLLKCAKNAAIAHSHKTDMPPLTPCYCPLASHSDYIGPPYSLFVPIMTAQLHKKYAIQQPEVHNLHYRHRRTELWPQLTCNFFFEVYMETERERG